MNRSDTLAMSNGSAPWRKKTYTWFRHGLGTSAPARWESAGSGGGTHGYSWQPPTPARAASATDHGRGGRRGGPSVALGAAGGWPGRASRALPPVYPLASVCAGGRVYPFPGAWRDPAARADQQGWAAYRAWKR